MPEDLKIDEAPVVSPTDSTSASTGGAEGEEGDCQTNEANGEGHNQGEGEEADEDGDNAEDDDDEYEELYACPLTVRFTQEKIHPFFYRRGPIVNVLPKIRPVLRAEGVDDHGFAIELMPPFGPIHCLQKGDELWSMDNRRLYALQLAAMEHWPLRCRVRLLASDRLPRRKLKTQWRKFQTTNEGRCINVCAKYQQFDAWNWFEKAVELEWYTLSYRLGLLMSAFEMLPVFGALLFRTGLTLFQSRMPLLVGFFLAFAVDLLRQKAPVFERTISELHVKAIMDGDVKQMSPFWAKALQAESQVGEGELIVSAPQVSATFALVLILVLPYVLGVEAEKLRSSFMSCWLGIACVLFFQLGSSLRSSHEVIREFTGSGQKLTPKHRE